MRKKTYERRKAAVRSGIQRRAEKLKTLIEQRAELVQQMETLANTIETEQRAFTEEEDTQFNDLETKVKALDSAIDKLERARKLKNVIESGTGTSMGTGDTEERETRAFENYVREACGGIVEHRAGEQNMTMGNNGAIIPTTIANRIIKTVQDICPIFAKATMYHVNGILKVPVWGKAGTDSSHDITVAYQTEFTDITADSGKFTSIDLSGYLAGALTLIGKSVINNAQVDVVGFIVTQMAREIAAFLEKELLIGTQDKAQGALSTSNTMAAASATTIAADELISLQAKIKQVFQSNACWIMHPDTFTALKKLKDGNNRYLLQDDFTGEFPYRMLGKPVYLSDNMPKMEAGKKAVLYGDLTGLSVNMRENIQIQILQEKYATMHAVGVVAWFEFDSKVTDSQKLAALSMKAA